MGVGVKWLPDFKVVFGAHHPERSKKKHWGNRCVEPSEAHIRALRFAKLERPKKSCSLGLLENLLQIIIHHYPIFSHSGLELSIAMFRLPEGKPDIAQPSLFIFCLRLYSTMISIYAFCIDTCYTVFSFQVPLVIWRFPSSHGTLSHPAMFIGFPWNKPSSDWGIPMTTWNPPSVQAKELLLCLLTLAISREMGSGWETLCFISSGL